MGDRRPKDSGGANHHYKMCKEITSKETSKQIFLYSMMTTCMTHENTQDCLNDKNATPIAFLSRKFHK
jgi:hypothetical protein